MTNQSAPTPKRDRSGLVVLAVLAGGVALIVILAGINSRQARQYEAAHPLPAASPTPVIPDRGTHLFGSVTSEGLDFVIRNNEFTDWTEVRLELNHRKYTARVGSIRSHEEVHVPSRDFTTDDGTRFSSLATKVLDLTILAHRANGTDGVMTLTTARKP
jgi:hypothetical protein